MRRLRLAPAIVVAWALLHAIPCSGQDPITADPSLAAMNRKLLSIIVPSVDFRSSLLSEVVDYLRDESRRHDPFPEGGPTGRGVNIVILHYPAVHGRITLALEQTTLLDALRRSAEQVGMTVSVQPYDVRIVPAQPEPGSDAVPPIRIAPGDREAAATLLRLETTLVSEVEFRSTSLSAVLEYLNGLGASQHWQLNFAFSQTRPPRNSPRRITMTLNNIPLLEMLRLLCLQGEMQMEITPQGAVFAER